ncbi:MAG: anaerobic ribonucleoside-triphosphate reductase [Methanobacteriota archaeon]
MLINYLKYVRKLKRLENMAASKSGVRVVKSSGDIETFEPNVISRDCVEAGIDFYTSAEVASEVAKRIYDRISTRDIQAMMLEILYKKHPEAAERYKRFHSVQVRTSRNTIENFDRKKITASLVRETRLPKELAETIARESEAELRTLKLDFVSAPLIREVVNVKLLEHGFEDARADYTRLGMPVYDATQIIEVGSKENAVLQNPESLHALMAGNIFKEYALLKILPLHLADAHMRGEIHIHDLDYFATRPCSARHDLRWVLRNGLKIGTVKAAPAKSLEMAVLQAAKFLEVASTNFSREQSFDFFNVYLAPYMQVEYGRIKQIAQIYIHESQSVLRRNQKIFLEYGCPKSLSETAAVLPGGEVKKSVTYSNFEEEARNFAKALAEIYLEGDHTGKPFYNPRAYYILRKENKEGYEEFLLLVHKIAAKFSTAYFLNLHSYAESNEKGSLQIVTLNLPRIAYEAGGDDTKFYEKLDERLNMAREAIMIKRDVIKHRMEQGLLPFLTQESEGEEYYRLDETSHSIAYIGAGEMVKAHTGEEMHESEDALKFGLRVIKYIYETTQKWSRDSGLNWVVTQAQSESAASRLAKSDYGKFSGNVVLRRVGKDLRYEFSHIKSDADVAMQRRLQLEGAFHAFTSNAVANIAVKDPTPETLLDLSMQIVNTPIRAWTYKEVK